MQATYHEPGLVPSGMLAVGVHVAFFALLFFGVNWQTRMNEPIMVDVWEEIPQQEAQPLPPPPPKPLPKVEVKLPPPPPPPPKVEEPSRADIELKAQERQRKKEELQRQKEEKVRLKEERRRAEEERVAEKRRKDEQVRQLEDERKLQDEARKRDEAMLDQVAKQQEKRKKDDEVMRKREAELAAQRNRVLDEHIARIRGKIQSKVNIPSGLSGNPEAHYKVTVLPGGDVMDIRLVKSSGVSAYDIAVERAIKASEPLPVPSEPELFQRMRELDLKFRPLE